MKEPFSGIYAHWRMLDLASYALIFSLWISRGIARGAVMFAFPPLVFGEIPVGIPIFLSAVAFAVIVAPIDRMISGWFEKELTHGRRSVDEEKRAKVVAMVASSLALAFLFWVYSYLFFISPGGVLAGARRGLAGGVGNFVIDLLVYFVLVLAARLLLQGKERLDRIFNTSPMLFGVVVVAALVAVFS